MKNILLSSLMLSCILCSNAASEGRKPAKGTFNTQVGVSLNSWSSMVNSFGLNGRYFLSPLLAPRLSVQMNNQSYERDVYENAPGSNNKGNYKSSSASTIFMLGFEKHFKGTKNLSPFIGIEAGLGFGKSESEGQNSSGWSYRANYSEEGEQKTSSSNLNAFLGFDYWITDGIYLGIEYKFFSFSSNVGKEGENRINDNGNIYKTIYPKSRNNFSSTLNTVPTFRLGWNF